MTFKEFLSKQKAGSDERGDFLCLAKADTDFPDVGTWGEFYTYFAARYNNRLAYVGAPLESSSSSRAKSAPWLNGTNRAVPTYVASCRPMS